jgi:hypothetical protein
LAFQQRRRHEVTSPAGHAFGDQCTFAFEEHELELTRFGAKDVPV